MAEQMQPMPDVPERCPFCNSGDRREETWRGSPAYSFSCGTVFCANGEVALRYFACYAREKEREERAIREQLAAALAEAERWRKKYEALRAGVERVADDLHMAADEAHDNWRITADFNEQGRSIGLEEAEQMVRRVLSEPGGGDT